jgi:hypothetical protein
MENERINDFVAMENSILTLSLVRDNLYLVSEGMNAMNSEPRSSNAVALNGEILDSTVQDLKEIFRRLEKLEHDNTCGKNTDN